MLDARELSKVYPSPRGALSILSGINLHLEQGDAIAIMGPSGVGKSTLLYMLGGLERPSSGEVKLDGINPYLLSEKDRAAFRNERIGFVFQDHCLLPQCSVLENVLVPTLIASDRAHAASRARDLLAQVGLTDRLDHKPAHLSGGEKQRVAVARALIRRPRLLLCDEPTGNLDSASAGRVAALLLGLPQRREVILIVVTHSAEIAAHFPARYDLSHAHLHAPVS